MDVLLLTLLLCCPALVFRILILACSCIDMKLFDQRVCRPLNEPAPLQHQIGLRAEESRQVQDPVAAAQPTYGCRIAPVQFDFSIEHEFRPANHPEIDHKPLDLSQNHEDKDPQTQTPESQRKKPLRRTLGPLTSASQRHQRHVKGFDYNSRAMNSYSLTGRTASR